MCLQLGNMNATQLHHVKAQTVKKKKKIEELLAFIIKY